MRGVFLEKYIETARHLEVQMFGDGKGEVIALGERDCSMQRRNQKVHRRNARAELARQAVAPRCCDAAMRLARAVDYRSAGTVEFVYDSDAAQFYFLEVNTRLQVEHGVTEQVCGVDLVRWMIELAAGTLAPLDELAARSDSRKATRSRRVCMRKIRAAISALARAADRCVVSACRWPSAAHRHMDRSGLRSAAVVRSDARENDRMAADPRRGASTRSTPRCEATRIYGVETNRDYLRQILARHAVRERPSVDALLSKASIIAHRHSKCSSGGTQTTVQDYPGRPGYWACGRAALGSDGRSRAAPRQPFARQRRASCRARNHDERADAAIQHATPSSR